MGSASGLVPGRNSLDSGVTIQSWFGFPWTNQRVMLSLVEAVD